MKKFIFSAFALMTTLFTLTSCDTDQKIANYLITGNWKGNLDTYYTNRWGDAFLDGEYYTVWRFEPGGYDDWGYVTSGYGTEADYNVYCATETSISIMMIPNGIMYVLTGVTTLSAQAVSAELCMTGKRESTTSIWPTSAIGIGTAIAPEQPPVAKWMTALMSAKMVAA